MRYALPGVQGRASSYCTGLSISPSEIHDEDLVSPPAESGQVPASRFGGGASNRELDEVSTNSISTSRLQLGSAGGESVGTWNCVLLATTLYLGMSRRGWGPFLSHEWHVLMC